MERFIIWGGDLFFDNHHIYPGIISLLIGRVCVFSSSHCSPSCCYSHSSPDIWPRWLGTRMSMQVSLGKYKVLQCMTALFTLNSLTDLSFSVQRASCFFLKSAWNLFHYMTIQRFIFINNLDFLRTSLHLQKICEDSTENFPLLLTFYFSVVLITLIEPVLTHYY